MGTMWVSRCTAGVWCVQCFWLSASPRRCLMNIWWVNKWMNESTSSLRWKKEKNMYSSVSRGDSRQSLSSLPPASDLPACFSFLIPSLVISKSTNRQASHSPPASAGPCLATVTLSVQFSTAVDHRTEPESNSGRSLLGRGRWVCRLGQKTIQIQGV